MMKQLLAFVSATLMTCAVWAQCAPGIPGAGNPGCVPPTQQGSPYYQGSDQLPAQPAPTARWEDRWGAVSVDPRGHVGIVTGAVSKSSAEHDALQKCSSSGGTSCDIAVSYYNQCAAIAQKPSGGIMGTSTAPTVSMAKSNALTECGDSSCRVVYSDCSMPERVN